MQEVLDLRGGLEPELGPKKQKKGHPILKTLIVVVLSVVLTTIGIRASDTLFGPDSENNEENSICPSDMAFIPSSEGGFCIDKYEASAGESCPHSNPVNQDETRANINASECKAISKKNVIPWRNISQNQAAVACAKAGKRLPTSKEWLQASLGTPDKKGILGEDDCQISSNWKSQPGSTGSGKDCISSAGANDMIGNVWEWVEGTINDGKYKGIPLPDEGYIKGIDSYGLPTETDLENPDPNYNEDYMWIKKNGTRGIARGGFWDNKQDAGQYAVYMVTMPSFIGTGVGFRCIK